MNRSITSFTKAIFALFFIAITTVSCSEDDVPALAFEDLGELHMRFTYNGTEYGIPDPITYNFSNKTVDATHGSGTNVKRITLFMPVNPTIGTHFITASPSDDSAYGAYFIAGTTVDILADTGIMTITAVTEDFVKGTFSFSGPNGAATVSVTEGSFLAER